MSIQCTTTTTTTTTTNFKLCCGDELRRVSLRRAALRAAARPLGSCWACGKPVMQWRDEEGDLVTIRSQAEWEEALSQFLPGCVKLSLVEASGDTDEHEHAVATASPVLQCLPHLTHLLPWL